MPPCGTPECSFCDCDKVSPILTFWDRSERKDLNQFTVFSLKPQIFNLSQRMFMSRQSNAADRSHIKMPVFSLDSVLSAHCFWTSDSAVMVERLALKPCWDLGSKLFDSIQLLTCSHATFSSSLAAAGRQVTGLQFLNSDLSPFLNTGVTIPSFHFCGNCPFLWRYLLTKLLSFYFQDFYTVCSIQVFYCGLVQLFPFLIS